MAHTLRRLVWPASLLAGLCLLTFFLSYVAPGDPARTILGLNARQDQVDQLRAKLGFDRPVAAQLGSYLYGVVTLNWGTSWLDGKPVLGKIGDYVKPTATIGLLASIFSIAIAIGLNALFFVWPNSSRIVLPPLRAGIGVPSFLVAMVAALTSSRLLPWFGGGGSSSTLSTLLPAAVAAACYPACLMTALLRDRFEAIGLAPYFRAAQAAGYSTSAMLRRVLLRNAAATLLTAWSNQISVLAFSTIIVEQVFSVRGIGALLVRSIQAKDLPVISGIVLLNGCFFSRSPRSHHISHRSRPLAAWARLAYPTREVSRDKSREENRFSRVGRLWCVLGACGALLVIPILVLPPFTSESSAYRIDVVRALQPPSSQQWFGTDSLGRSQWDRLLLGTQVSFRTVILSIAIAFPLSLLMGGIAGLATGRWPDRVINWVIALLHTTPFFLLVVAAAAVFRSSVGALPWLIGGVIWAAPARIVRAEIDRLAQRNFVLAEKAQGANMATVFRRSLLPLVVAPAALSLLYLFPEIVGIDAVLALFGLGAQPPTPTLGELIYEGIRRWDAAPWLAGIPAMALLLYCIALHLLTDRLAEQVEAGAK